MQHINVNSYSLISISSYRMRWYAVFSSVLRIETKGAVQSDDEQLSENRLSCAQADRLLMWEESEMRLWGYQAGLRRKMEKKTRDKESCWGCMCLMFHRDVIYCKLQSKFSRWDSESRGCLMSNLKSTNHKGSSVTVKTNHIWNRSFN